MSLVLPLLAAAVLAAPEQAVILIYHHVDARTPASTSTRPDDFLRHLELIEAEDCTVLPLDEVVAGLRDPQAALPDRTVALTFDDGYRSVYAEAFPLLRERGWPFTVFVSPAAVDRGEGPACTWDQLREMAGAGALIAGHGLVHDHLQRRRPGEDETAWRRRLTGELQSMQERIAKEIGHAPALLAYPYGESSPALDQLVQELGLVAFGQQSGPAGAGSLAGPVPRFPAGGPYADPEGLRTKLRTLPLPLAAAAPADPRLTAAAGGGAVRPEIILTLAHEPPGLGAATAFDGERTSPVGRDGLVLTVPAGPALGPGRSRTNITAPSAWPGRWYWYSHSWIVGEEHED